MTNIVSIDEDLNKIKANQLIKELQFCIDELNKFISPFGPTLPEITYFLNIQEQKISKLLKYLYNERMKFNEELLWDIKDLKLLDIIKFVRPRPLPSGRGCRVH